MLDVLHYLLDEDATVSSGEAARAKSEIRTTLYKTLYNREYVYSTTSSSNSFDEDFEPAAFGGSSSREVKPYMAPTNFNPDAANPFQGALRETPLG